MGKVFLNDEGAAPALGLKRHESWDIENLRCWRDATGSYFYADGKLVDIIPHIPISDEEFLRRKLGLDDNDPRDRSNS
ncbi:hypothetical protein [Noviluteimonas dokdonensis]|uniref:hypothetical protein n=1 Tax=Noviluteimonas dokdonensis TaxID=414050 RepID=UPI00126A6084|nr:hypothetical protein [Lysobacter dokdonensis]